MSNEADAVREFIADARAKGDEHICLAFDFALDALAAERRATVERIRAALTDKRIDLAGYDGDQIVANPTGDLLFVEEVLAILDAEAQR